MNRDVINIDEGGRQSLFFHRFAGNAMAIMLADAIAVAGALCLGNLLLWWVNDIPFSIRNGFLIVPAWLVVSALARLLPGWGMGVVEELRRIQHVLFVMFSVVLVVSYITQVSFASSRIVFLITYLFCVALIPFLRASARAICVHMGCWGIPVVLYGDSISIKEVLDCLHKERGLGYIPTAIFSDEFRQGSIVCGTPVLGNLHNTTFRAPVAIVSMGNATRHKLIQTLEGPLEVYRRVIIIPDLLEAPSLWVIPRDLQGLLGLEVTKNLLNPFALLFKKFVDISAILCTAPFWGPLMLLLYILIWIEDRKNPIFLQPRMGKAGKIFNTIKFRTMVPDAEKVLEKALEKDPLLRKEWELHFKLKKDPRITKVGNFLRKTSLDEIPQLLNVLDGSMSIVGPRPLPSYHFQELPERVRFLRNKVQPGITGLWQVSGRSEAGTAGMEKWDPYYVRNWSVWLDLFIVVRTFRAVLGAHGAY